MKNPNLVVNKSETERNENLFVDPIHMLYPSGELTNNLKI